jgi:hypothetical protein
MSKLAWFTQSISLFNGETKMVESFIKIIILKQQPEQAYPELFFKK